MDTYDFLTDPRSLPLADRLTARRTHEREQEYWLTRVRELAEPPAPADDFPAFLLATPAFAELARRLEQAEHRSALPTETADELDWFVGSFADYLRTCEGEDSFAASSPRRPW